LVGSSADGVEKRRLADLVIHSYYKAMEPPTQSEGFSDVLQVPFVPLFESSAQRDAFFQYFE
jgi:hypothetical protein